MEWKPCLYAVVAFSLLVGALWSANQRAAHRHRQLWCPPAAFSIVCAALWLYLHPYLFVSDVIDFVVEFLKRYIAAPDPDTAHGFPLYYNLAILTVFWAIKAAVHFVGLVFSLICRAWRWLLSKFSRKKSPGSTRERPWLAYTRHSERGVMLKDSWVYTSIFMLFAGVFAFIVLIVLLCIHFSRLQPSLSEVLPLLPAIPLLMLIEIAWYLGGPRPLAGEGLITVEEADPRLEGECYGLWDAYATQWKDRILSASHELVNRRAGAGAEAPHCEDSDIAGLISAMTRQGIRLNPHQYTALKDLWGGADVLLSAADYNRIAPALFASLQRDIMEGRTVIFLTDSRRTSKNREELRQWVERWLGRPLFAGLACRIADITDFRRNDEVLMTSVRELLDAGITGSEDWFARLKTVVVLSVPDVIFPDILSASALFQVLKDQTEHTKLQLILLTTDNRVTMESSTRSYLNAEPEEHGIFGEGAGKACYILWKLEGGDAYQAGMVECNSYLGAEPIIGLRAFREGLAPVYLANLENVPWREYIEELNKVEPPNRVSGTVRDGFNYLAAPCTRPADRHALVVLRDHDCNPVDALIKSFSLASDTVFAHVVSPPSLLRDYMARNVEFFLKAPLSALTPTLRKSSATVAYCLGERLLRRDLTEEEICRQLGQIHPMSCPASGTHGKISLDEVFHQAFGHDSLGIDQCLLLTTGWEYVMDTREFKEVHRFSLSRQARQVIAACVKDYYKVLDPDDNILEIIPGDHIYQNYLPGQIHPFQGKPFQINEVDSSTRTVTVGHQSTRGSIQYRHSHAIRVKAIRACLMQDTLSTSSAFVVEKVLREADFDIRTTRFYSFLKGIDFSACESKGLPEAEVPARPYRQGRMLCLSIKNSQSDIAGAEAISFTLALLLNELFPTLFPESWRYVMAAAPPRQEPSGSHGDVVIAVDSAPPPLMGAEGDPASVSDQPTTQTPPDKEGGPDSRIDLKSKSLGDLVPSLTLPDDGQYTSKGSVSIFIFEDSKNDMGLIETIHLNLEYLFEILEDYLTWLQQEESDARSFLAYGYPEIPADLKLNETLELLSGLLKHRPNTLRQRRERFRTKGEDEEQQGAVQGRVCDFCGETMSGTIFEQLKDGRERCPNCTASAVDNEDKNTLGALYEDARRFMAREFKIILRKGIEVTFTNAGRIQEIAGQSFIPTSGFDPRTIGVAVREGDNYRIYQENGQPRHMILACMVHELTHIWQFENLDFERMQSEQGLLLSEGHAVWAEIHCLRSKGIGEKYCERETSRDDVYGQGFRLVEQLVRDSGARSAFDLLREKYPI